MQGLTVKNDTVISLSLSLFFVYLTHALILYYDIGGALQLTTTEQKEKKTFAGDKEAVNVSLFTRRSLA